MNEQEKLRKMRIIWSELDPKTEPEREWQKDTSITPLEQIAKDVFPKHWCRALESRISCFYLRRCGLAVHVASDDQVSLLAKRAAQRDGNNCRKSRHVAVVLNVSRKIASTRNIKIEERVRSRVLLKNSSLRYLRIRCRRLPLKLMKNGS
jgi:hypothetical protein